MLSIEYQRVQDYDSNGNPIYRIIGFGLSTDTKPTQGVANGSAIVEMDSGNVCFFDQDNTSWLEWGATPSTSVSSLSMAASPAVIRPNLGLNVSEPSVVEPDVVEDIEPEEDVQEEPEQESEPEQEEEAR